MVVHTTFLQDIHRILRSHVPPINPPSFIFEPTLKAATHNQQIIVDSDSLHFAIANQPDSPVSYGTEFLPAWMLAPLMHCHPLWGETEQRLNHGSNYPLLPIEDSERQRDLVAALTYGNHRSVSSNPKFEPTMKEEILYG